MTEDAYLKELGEGEWIEILAAPEDSKTWTPIQKNGAELLVQTGQGEYSKYVLENGRYNLVGEVTNG